MSYAREIENIISGDKEDFNKKIEIIAVITTAVEEQLGIRPVIVGGQAVEFYTAGGYSTMDIDLICEASTDKIDAILNRLGFARENKYWMLTSEDMEIALEIPSGPLAGDNSKITRINTPGGHTAYVISVEDILIDRLNACVHWNETWQEEWIIGIIVLNYTEIDWEYLNKRAKREKVADDLRQMKLKAEKIRENENMS